MLWSLVWVVGLFIVCVSERRIICVPRRRKPTFAGCRFFPMLPIKGPPADHDTQKCGLGAMLIYVWICHFLWVVDSDYTRPRGCLLSANLAQMWLRTVTANVHEHRVTKIIINNKWIFMFSFVFILYLSQ